MAKQAYLFPLDTGESIAAKYTRAQKVTYFLQYVVEPGAEEYLPKLLKVMRDSKVANVVRLADDIQAATGLGKCDIQHRIYTAIILISIEIFSLLE